jgi:hypothetical protein
VAAPHTTRNPPYSSKFMEEPQKNISLLKKYM